MTAEPPQGFLTPMRSGDPLCSHTASLDPSLSQAACPCYPTVSGGVALNLQPRSKLEQIFLTVRGCREARGILNASQKRTSGCFVMRFQILAFNHVRRAEMPGVFDPDWGQAHTLHPAGSSFQSPQLWRWEQKCFRAPAPRTKPSASPRVSGCAQPAQEGHCWVQKCWCPPVQVPLSLE